MKLLLKILFTHYTINAMKTITLTDKQFDSIFDFIDSKLEFVLEYEIDNPDILEEWADLFDAHEALHNVKKEYEDKLAKAQAKQPKAEW